MVGSSDELIITAASESYRAQLLAFLGSLRCNWPSHPPVLVYDLGLSLETRQLLDKAGVGVREVPAFVPHWRKHYTWKSWCWNDAPAQRILWLDSGCCVLRPLPEIFEIIQAQGYFGIPNYQPLEVEASLEACEGCGVAPEFRLNKVSFAANVFGFARGTAAERVVTEVLRVARTERYIKAHHWRHRHDQAILSLLMYRDIHPLTLCDGTIYSFEDLKARITIHAIWAIRRGMHPKDLEFYTAALFGSARPQLPRPSPRSTPWFKMTRGAYLMLKALKPGGKKEELGMHDGVRR